MEVVIISPFAADADGVVEYFIKDEKLCIRYSLNCRDSFKQGRLWAMSASKPGNMPFCIDFPRFAGECASGSRDISSVELGVLGYLPGDIDTFALTYGFGTSVHIGAIGYRYLKWNISYSIGRILKNENKNPVSNAAELLCRLKKPSVDSSYYRALQKSVMALGQKLPKCNQSPLAGYEWYHFKGEVYPLNISIYKHLTQTSQEAFCRDFQKRLLFGVGGNGHTALACKTNGANPFENAADCAVKTGCFWVVGVWLNFDGQYFEKIIIK